MNFDVYYEILEKCMKESGTEFVLAESKHNLQQFFMRMKTGSAVLDAYVNIKTQHLVNLNLQVDGWGWRNFIVDLKEPKSFDRIKKIMIDAN